jgi:hypothetical protein
MYFVPMFDYSLKRQNVNPRKVYAIDPGLVEVNTPGFTKDMGHKLENIVFLALRRSYRQIYYFSRKGECDFLVMDRGVIAGAIQVCLELNSDNLQRECAGLFEAMQAFHLQEGTIVTLSQTDHFVRDGMKVNVIPFHEFVAGKSLRTQP